MAIKIITDSTSDLSKEMAAKWDIEIAPLAVLFGEEELLDGVDITRSEFYERLAVCTTLPTTAQVNPDYFFNSFKKHTDEGHEVICILVSQVFSGTMQSALIALEMLGDAAKHITIIDSETVCLALGALTIEAAKLREAGLSVQEITEQINTLKKKAMLYAIIDDLKYLVMGGRLSKTSKVVGSLLGIKPILKVKDNKIEAIDKVRGLSKGCDWLMKKLDAEKPDLEKTIFIGHTNAPEKVEQLVNAIGDKDYMKQAIYGEIGPTVGVHAGPGCLGFAYFLK